MLDIERAKELCEKATPGPWNKAMVVCGVVDLFCVKTSARENLLKREDADFILKARTVLPEALDMLERLEWFKEASEFLHNHAWEFWWTIQCGNACKEARATYLRALRDAEEES